LKGFIVLLLGIVVCVGFLSLHHNSTLYTIDGTIAPIPEAHALLSADFGISIAKTCYVMHKNNITTSCPTYEAIFAIFPDTSNQDVSGKFIFRDGLIQRGYPQMKDNYEWYKYETETLLFVDPDAQTQSKLKMITIYANLPTFKLRDGGMSNKVVDGLRYLGDGRYIEDCRNAVIDGKRWLFLLGDTINYMKNGCDPAFTQFNSTVEYQAKLMDHDITTSNKWLHDAFLEYVKENCLNEYDVC